MAGFTPSEQRAFLLGSAGVALLLLALYFLIGFDRVEFNEYGLVYDHAWSTVDTTKVYENGLHFIGAFKSFMHYPSTLITFRYSHNDLSVRSQDKLPVQMQASFHFSLNRDSIPFIFENFLDEYEEVYNDIAHHSIRVTASSFNVSDFFDSRQDVIDQMTEDLRTSLAEVGANLYSFEIHSIILPPLLETAIIESTVAAKNRHRATFIRDTTIVEVQKDLAVARIQADITITKAQSECDALLLESEATAHMLRNTSLANLEARINMKNVMGWNFGQLLRHLRHRVIREHNDNRVVLSLPRRFLTSE
ncbi:hypothetical protein RCL1_007684 [Eukaryota sp. TZLM3-RCL]